MPPAGANFVPREIEAFFLAAKQHHPRAFGSESAGDAAANALAGSQHEHAFVLELEVHTDGECWAKEWIMTLTAQRRPDC